MLEARNPSWIPLYKKMAPGRLERALGGDTADMSDALSFKDAL